MQIKNVYRELSQKELDRLIKEILDRPVYPKQIKSTGKPCYDMVLLMKDFDLALENPNSEPLPINYV